MNVFENMTSTMWDVFEGRNLLKQAELPIKTAHSFDSTRETAEEFVCRGWNWYGAASFEVPMWFVRAMRKHYFVVDYNVSGHSGGKWIHTYRNSTEVVPWSYGGSIDATVCIKINGALLFFRKKG